MLHCRPRVCRTSSRIPQIHISKVEAPEESPDHRVVGKAVKLMHRFDPDEIEAKMDQVEGKSR